MESLPTKFPVAGGACIAGRLRSFSVKDGGAGYLKFCEVPLPRCQSPAISLVRDSELNVYLPLRGKEQPFPKTWVKIGVMCDVAISQTPEGVGSLKTQYQYIPQSLIDIEPVGDRNAILKRERLLASPKPNLFSFSLCVFLIQIHLSSESIKALFLGVEFVQAGVILLATI